MLLVRIDNLLNLIITAQEDATAVVDMLRNDREHPPHMTINSLTTS